MRIYKAKVNNTLVIVLLGGNKNGQSKDIKKAKKLLAKFKGCHFG
jgi:putative addiction module killer protein